RFQESQLGPAAKEIRERQQGAQIGGAAPAPGGAPGVPGAPAAPTGAPRTVEELNALKAREAADAEAAKKTATLSAEARAKAAQSMPTIEATLEQAGRTIREIRAH